MLYIRENIFIKTLGYKLGYLFTELATVIFRLTNEYKMCFLADLRLGKGKNFIDESVIDVLINREIFVDEMFCVVSGMKRAFSLLVLTVPKEY